MTELFKSRRVCSGSRLMQTLKYENVHFENFSRMSDNDFEYLLNRISGRISRKDTNFRKAIPAKERLAVTLRYLATGDSYSSLSYLFRISKQLISRIIPEVCEAIIDVLKKYIQVR